VAVIALLSVSGCGDAMGAVRDGTGPVPVVTVSDVYADIVRTVGGDDVTVTSLISSESGADPHSYETTARDVLAVKRAALVVANGGGYDDFLTRDLASAGGQRTVITAVTEALHEDEDAGSPAPHDHRPAGNEHVWYDLRAMSVLAGSIANALGQVRPADSADFVARAGRFQASLAQLMERQKKIREQHGGEAVAITEALPLYLLDDCGLVNRTSENFSEAIEEGTDVPARVLQETLALFRDHVVKVLVPNAQTTGPQTDRVRDAATAAGIPVVPMSETLPRGTSYLDWMNGNLDALAAALDGPAGGAR
jgi:zinc/manganese transport system substrate-binding protein